MYFINAFACDARAYAPRTRMRIQRVSVRLIAARNIEVLFVKVTVFILLLFASLPDCHQNQITVSDEQYSLSDF
jgi:hypothetical protein